MATIERDIWINTPVEAAWAMIADLGHPSRWMPDVKERHMLGSGAYGAGSQWEEHGLIRGKPYKVRYEMTHWEPPRRLDYRQISSRGGAYQWVESVTIKPENDGARVTASLSYRLPRGLAGRVYELLIFRRDFAATLDNRLAALKELLEGSS